MKMGMRSKLTVLLLLLSLVPILTIGFLSFKNSQKMLAESIGSKLPDIAQSAMNSVDGLIRFAVVDAKTWANLGIMQEILTEDADKRLGAFLSNIKSGYADYKDFYCTDNKGKIIASTNQKRIGSSAAEEPWFKSALAGQLVIDRVQYSPLSEGWVLGISIPVRASYDENQTIGVFTAHLDWQILLDEFSKILVDGSSLQTVHSHLTMIDKDGVVLLNPEFERKADPSSLFSENLVRARLKSVKLAREGKRGWITETNEHGEMSLVGHAPSQGFREFKGLGWSMLIFKSLQEAYAPIRALQRRIFFIVLLLMLLLVLIANRVAKNIAHPLMRLMEVACFMSDGDLTQLVSVEGKDEIGQLGGAFNKLIENMRRITRQIRDAGMQIMSSASQIRTAAENQAAGASEQSSAVSEATSTIQELAAAASRIAENVENVARTAEYTLAGMQEINAKVDQTSKRILVLGEKSQSIGNITSLIDDLAEQTNLLALNAAIEAARAGEAGKGFAVVAQEIRKLAERSSESTEEIRQLIGEIQTETNSTIVGIEDSTKWVSKGLEMVKETTRSAKEISLATQQQKSASSQIVQAMANVDLLAKQFVVATREAASSAMQLNRLSQEFRSVIGGFKLGDEAQPPPPAKG